MPGRYKIDITTVLITAWALLGGAEVNAWLSGGHFPPTAVMTYLHTGLATVSVVVAIAKRERSAKANYELGRDVQRLSDGRGERSGLRAVEEQSR